MLSLILVSCTGQEIATRRPPRNPEEDCRRRIALCIAADDYLEAASILESMTPPRSDVTAVDETAWRLGRQTVMAAGDQIEARAAGRESSPDETVERLSEFARLVARLDGAALLPPRWTERHGPQFELHDAVVKAWLSSVDALTCDSMRRSSGEVAASLRKAVLLLDDLRELLHLNDVAAYIPWLDRKDFGLRYHLVCADLSEGRADSALHCCDDLLRMYRAKGMAPPEGVYMTRACCQMRVGDVDEGILALCSSMDRLARSVARGREGTDPGRLPRPPR